MTPRWVWLGRVPFAATTPLQERLRDQIIRGDAPETLLLLEHDPVITLGRSANAAHVLAAPQALAARGIAVAAASRGGDVTYHGPGQLVGYPLVRLRSGVVGHMRAMADGLSAVLADLGIRARWDRQAPGLWVGGAAGGIGEGGGEPPAKICAFGVHVRQRVAMHGFALNVTSDLDAFRLIVPCGLPDAPVTSIVAQGVTPPSLPVLAARVAEAFSGFFGVSFAKATHADLAIDSAAIDHAPADVILPSS